MGKLIQTFVAAIMAVAPPALAEQQKDPLLDHMTGNWLLAGTIDGSATTHDVDADWVLDNGYVRLHEVSRTPAKEPYEALVLIGYDRTKSRYVCFWFDNTGIASPASGAVAQRKGNTLPFLFKTAQGNLHTTFIYDSRTDSWQWKIDEEEKGKTEPFARVTLKRR